MKDRRESPIVFKKIVNMMMREGKYARAEKTYLQMISHIQEVTNKPSSEIIKSALQNVIPVLSLKTKKIAGQSYQIPTPIKDSRAIFLGIKWILQAAKKSGVGKDRWAEYLAKEFIAAANKQGAAVKAKEDLYKLILQNRPFLKFMRQKR